VAAAVAAAEAVDEVVGLLAVAEVRR